MKRQVPVSLPDGYIDFFKALETWQNEQQIKLKQAYTPAEIDILKTLSNTKRPVMQSTDFALDSNQFKELYLDLLQFVKNHRPEIDVVIDKISANLDQLDFNLLPVKLLEEDQDYFSQLSVRLDVSSELLIFTVDHALRPLIRMWASSYQSTISEAGFNVWDIATLCPFCGAKSHFSRIRAADGRRYMFCDCCFTEWETRNVYCVHCGNDNPHSIQFLSIEDDLAYQICTCDECKGYIKSFDERQKGNRADLFIANIETVYLDMLAQEKGYTSHDND